MPHLVAEYSDNLENKINIPGMVKALHDSALATGVFPIGGLRTRAQAREHYRIADGHPDNAYVHVTVWIGHGRDAPTKQKAAQQIFDALVAYLQAYFDRAPIGISLNLQELDPVLNFKHNNLHDYVKQRTN